MPLRMSMAGRDVLILRGDAAADVRHKQDGVRSIDDGELRLPAHMTQQHVVRFWLDAAGIDEQKTVVLPFAVAVQAVPRDAGSVFDNCQPLAYQLIEQCGFADIRPPHDGYDGFP